VNKKYLTPAMLAVAALVAACGSTPKTTALLEQTRADYLVAQASPRVAEFAPLELKQAGDALAQANTQATERASDQRIDQFAYLAKQKIALTQEVSTQKAAEAEIANAGKVRDKLVLDQRTNEANAAGIRAANATQVAAMAQNDAAQAKQQTLQAQNDAARAQQQTLAAQNDAATALAKNSQLEAQLNDLAAKKTERGMVITLSDVLFGTDLSTLNSNGLATVQKVALVLTQNPGRSVLIEGFADSTGTDAHNLALSERRAQSVQSALNARGIGSDRAATRGYGEAFPVAANDTAQNRQLNRRVEIVLSDDGGKVMAR
jgi:outer membrane protein OmpA-like peptidoglycan-associated protein